MTLSILSRIVAIWGLLALLVVLIVVFSILRPDTFPTAFNFRAIVSSRSINALVALAILIPMVANHFDLSTGFLLGIAQVLAIGLQSQDGLALSWPLAGAAVLALGALVGLFNGLLITRVGMDSFIATLGTGTMLYGFNAWFTGGQQVLASLPRAFTNISTTVRIGSFGIPAPAIYVLILGLLIWYILEHTPLGRQLYVIGASPKAAELNGIPAARRVTGAFVASGLIAAFAGIVLQAQLQVGQSSVGQEYLLPGFTAALLGATSIRPGRVNVWGTVLAVAVLAVTVAGLNQLGAPFFVEPLFNGAMLILAVGLAVITARRRNVATTRSGRRRSARL